MGINLQSGQNYPITNKVKKALFQISVKSHHLPKTKP